MGEVYSARDARLARDVAIKILPSSFAGDPDRRARFEREAQAVAALSHPNVIAIFDTGVHGQHPYIVMELLAGQTLRERLTAGLPALPVRKAVDIAVQIARGLSAAHAKDVVHRDLKPENIFLLDEGQVKILDFGLARPAASDHSGETLTIGATDPGTVLGTIGYMAPEQVRGQVIDTRADLFAFGAVLYEMVAGQRAFQRDTPADTMTAILKEDPPDLTGSNRAIPTSLDRIIRHCLEKSSAERFQTARDVAFALESLSGSIAPLGPSGERSVVEQPAVRNRWVPALLLAAALVALGAMAGVFAARSLWRPLPPVYHRLTFNRGTVWNARFAPDGQTVMYSATWNGNPLSVFSVRAGNADSRPLNLGDTDVLAVSPSNEMLVLRDRRALSFYQSRGTLSRVSIDGGAARELLEDVQEADWSPDGANVAIVRWVDGRSQLEYPVGTVLYHTAGYISHPRVSPKGDRVAFMDHQVRFDNRGAIAVVDGAGNKTTLSGEWASEEGLAWSPSGEEVWFTASRSGEADALYAVTLAGQERLVLQMTSRLMLNDIARDGRVLLTSFHYTTSIASKAGQDSEERDLSLLDLVLLVDLSPDGKMILLENNGEGSGANYAVYVRGTDGSPAIKLGDGSAQRLSPDGKWALSLLHKPPQLALLPTGAGSPRTLDRGRIEQYAYGAAWLPNGKSVVFAARESGHDWRCYIQDADGGPARAVTPEGTAATKDGLIVSPDGRILIALSTEGRPQFYPLDGGMSQSIPHLEDADRIMGWTSDGHSLYIYRVQQLPFMFKVYTLDPATGRRTMVREVAPADQAGILPPSVIMITPDGKGAAYSVRRVLSDLYMIEGLE